MTKLTKNLDIFFQSYDLTKSNYNIIIHSPNGTGKYDFVISLIGEYYKNNKISLSDDILSSPDILYISLPLFDKSSKRIRVLSNDERLIYEFGFEEKFENCRVGTHISVEQIRELKDFTSLTSHYGLHKIIIINNCNYLNNQSAAALLKTLEETNTKSIFLLLTSEINYVKDTIKSRCHSFPYIYETEHEKAKNFHEYYISSIPKIKEIALENNYLESFDKLEDEIEQLFKNKINPLSISNQWMERGSIIIDFLIQFFSIMMKGPYLNVESSQRNIYHKLYDKISISPARSIEILKLLINRKKEVRHNLNKKMFYDNLLIVLNEELY
tara:strand:+ start:117 stop:1097 length:981 start_codon:yes stop_codon:yes gene_type:complete